MVLFRDGDYFQANCKCTNSFEVADYSLVLNHSVLGIIHCEVPGNCQVKSRVGGCIELFQAHREGCFQREPLFWARRGTAASWPVPLLAASSLARAFTS